MVIPVIVVMVKSTSSARQVHVKRTSSDVKRTEERGERKENVVRDTVSRLAYHV